MYIDIKDVKLQYKILKFMFSLKSGYSLDLTRVLSKKNLMSSIHAWYNTIPNIILFTSTETLIQIMNNYIRKSKVFLILGKIIIKVINDL